MRMWNVNPKTMCRKHLLGEHLECHMFVGSILLGKSIEGYIVRGQVEVHNIKNRHDELVAEMERRGYNHESPLAEFPAWTAGSVNTVENVEELKRRCPDCRTLAESVDNDTTVL